MQTATLAVVLAGFATGLLRLAVAVSNARRLAAIEARQLAPACYAPCDYDLKDDADAGIRACPECGREYAGGGDTCDECTHECSVCHLDYTGDGWACPACVRADDEGVPA